MGAGAEGTMAMLDAFMLIQVDAGAGSKVRHEISAIQAVRIAHSVTGPYDLVARVHVEDMDTLGALLSDIQQVPGVLRTLTCIVKGLGRTS
jgi:DNA-binding Lrp family transcriptional regulator